MRGEPCFIPENRKSNFLKNGRFPSQIDITQFPSQTAVPRGTGTRWALFLAWLRSIPMKF